MEDKKSLLTVDVSLKDTKIFKEILVYMGELLTDNRIDGNVRVEYLLKLIEIIKDR